jgi:hypothetical protein
MATSESSAANEASIPPSALRVLLNPIIASISPPRSPIRRASAIARVRSESPRSQFPSASATR